MSKRTCARLFSEPVKSTWFLVPNKSAIKVLAGKFQGRSSKGASIRTLRLAPHGRWGGSHLARLSSRTIPSSTSKTSQSSSRILRFCRLDVHLIPLLHLCPMGLASRRIHHMVGNRMVSQPVTHVPVNLCLRASSHMFDREWALLLPAYSVVLMFLAYFTYFALAIFGTPAFSDMSTMIGMPRYQLMNITTFFQPSACEQILVHTFIE